MKDVRITALRRTFYKDLIETLELPMTEACSVRVGDIWISHDAKCPESFCESAWGTLEPFVKELANDGGYFFGSWMRDPHSALLSCNDGFRPVSFLIETVE